MAGLARRQHGVATRAQLLALGLSRHTIDRMLRAARLHALHRGVYVVGHRALAPLAIETGALLAVGGDVLLSEATALALWGLGQYPTTVDVTAVGRRRRHRHGVAVHFTAELATQDRCRRHGLPVTSPARTALDVAGLDGMSDGQLERAVGEALTQRLVRIAELDDVLGRANGHRGCGRLGEIVERARAGGPVRTRSDAEAELLDLIRRAGLPMPQVNARVHGYEVDFLWPEHRLVLELDGFRYHSTPLTADRDHRKTQVLTAAGLIVLRASPRQTEREPVALVARLAMSLGAAGGPGRRRPSDP